MKTKKILFAVLIAMMLTSCVSPYYFQVYKTVPTDEIVVSDNKLVYEDENCEVTYNLWGEGGNIGFQIYNKTDKNIYLNLEESFFILNGFSYNYYKNRVFTSSSILGTTTSTDVTATQSATDQNLIQTNRISQIDLMTSSGISVTYNEEKIVCVPSKTSKIISEYNINKTLFRDCDLYKYPTRRQIKSKTFSKEQSPLVFSNRIAYFIEQTDNLIRFENEFYVSEISNYPESEMFEYKSYEFCDQKSVYKSSYFKDISAEKFYIRYYKDPNDRWIH